MKVCVLTFVLQCVFGVMWVDAAKTVTISSPSCNLNTVVEIPTTKCCCPVTVTPKVPTTTVRTPPTSSNTLGCMRIRTYSTPNCRGSGNTLYPGSTCTNYYRCTGVGTYTLGTCSYGTKFSIVSGSCVSSSILDLCCKA